MSPTSNIRHDLDPALASAQTATKIARMEKLRIRDKKTAEEAVARYEQDVAAGTAGRNWVRRPDAPETVDQRVDRNIALERDHYSLVRVIELPQEGKRFVLAYGEQVDSEVTSGTGPFESVEQATVWFLNGGR